MTDKRHVSLLVPYLRRGGEPHFFLQMRDGNAPVYPNQYGFFGGHVEPGETAEQAMLRESAEELTIRAEAGEDPYRPRGYFHLGRYEEETAIRDVFAVEVDEGFAGAVEVHEGEYGAFLPASGLDAEPLVIDAHRQILRDLVRRLSG